VGYLTSGLLQAIGLITSLNPEVLGITSLSLEVSCTAVLFAALAGIPLGIIFALSDFPLKRLLKNVINTCMGLPPVVIGLFVYLMISRAGPFGTFGILFTPTAMVIAQFILVTPIIMGLSISAANAVDRAVTDTAVSLGARRGDVMLLVANEARQPLVTAVLAGFGRAVAEVGAVMIVGGNIRWSTRVLTTAVVLETGMGDYGMALALGIILLSLSFTINIIVSYLQEVRK
jgi:tungstate transport system permease protein